MRHLDHPGSGWYSYMRGKGLLSAINGLRMAPTLAGFRLDGLQEWHGDGAGKVPVCRMLSQKWAV